MNAQDIKSSILQLAIQGKLVEQRAEDGTARELLKEIEAEKKQLIKTGKLKKQKDLLPINEDEIPFEIPESWEWIKIGNICEKIGSGSTPTGGKIVYKDSGIKFLRSQNIYDDGIRMGGIVYISENQNRPNSLVFPKDILLNITGGSIGRCALVPDEFDFANINQHVMIIRNICFELRFFMHLTLISPYIKSMIMNVQVGVSREGLSAEKLKNFLIPIPPLDEQKRIVAKIQELLPYVDKYDSAHYEVEELNKKFPENIKKSILQYAIQGKLVEQRAEEGTAENLYKQIQEERKKLIKEGKIAKNKALPEIKEDEIPFDIPESWKWVRLGGLCDYGKCNSIHSNNIPKEAWVLDLEDIEKDSGVLLTRKRMNDAKANSTKHVFKFGDVLYSKLRPYLNKVIIADEDGYSTSEIIPLNFGVNIYNKYAQLVLMSPYFVNYTVKCSYGVKMPRLGTVDGKLAFFQLPPIAEQYRIVNKIEELLPHAKKLENSLVK